MKTKYLFLGLAALSLASCDDYLDKLPDDRATLDTKEKITQLLTSAYPATHIAVMAEISSDNVGNNGNSYGVTSLLTSSISSRMSNLRLVMTARTMFGTVIIVLLLRPTRLSRRSRSMAIPLHWLRSWPRLSSAAPTV